MTETAEAQILAAAHQSIEAKATALSQQPAGLRAKLATELTRVLNQQSPALKTLLSDLRGDIALPEQLQTLSGAELQQLHKALEICWHTLYPPSTGISKVQSLSLVDFEAEDDFADDDDSEAFSLIDFEAEGPSESSSESEPKSSPKSNSELNTEALRQPLWLLNQLIAAWYFVHHRPPA
ncbi:MAG: hypothetical protein CVV27_17805 [Candidatus Melainabacteria bacterium HGW-Melainabacteria-1]|nr:MAG: hypothetical protein CVV27_17805 [Candidatus Melainabacteria bacterium HGW-Melainabacteria-1]